VPEVNVDETVKAVTKTTNDLVTIAWQAGVGVVIGLVIAFVVVAILTFMGRRRLLYREIVDFGRRPIVAVGAMTGAFLGSQLALTGLRHTKSDSTTMVVIERGVTIALIVSVTWLVVAFAKAIESTVVKGAQAGGDQGRANRVTTQSQILRRVAQVIIVIAGLVSAIMTFPSVQFAMGSLLASAGLASVIAGMAARSMLGNVFAGLQLATTDAIRVDDIVVVDDEQGTIEEITLTYVVMRTWDDRRLILPSTHFTENPFANWTRGGSQATGYFTLDLDWRVPIASLRAELARLVAASSVWDGRQASLEVFDAVGGHVTVRIVLTGDDPGDVGIETGQQRPPGSRTLGDDGVDRTGHSGQRVDGVEHGKHCLLVRHSHAQARPSGLSGARSSDLSQYRGQMLRVHFPQVVHPPLQSEHSVCGSVQHRRQRVRDGQTDDGRTARRVAGPWSGHGGQPSVPAEASGGLGVAEGFGPGLELLP